ncbi:hypothetical protein RQP46_009831 [Phenoliferia psychrophenolica]
MRSVTQEQVFAAREVLKVDRNATLPELKKAFHRIARLVHPDKNLQSAASHLAFRQLQDAFDVLCENLLAPPRPPRPSPEDGSKHPANVDFHEGKYRIESAQAQTERLIEASDRVLSKQGCRSAVFAVARSGDGKAARRGIEEDDVDVRGKERLDGFLTEAEKKVYIATNSYGVGVGKEERARSTELNHPDTLLDFAMRFVDSELLKFLVSRGASVSNRDYDSFSPFHRSLVRGAVAVPLIIYFLTHHTPPEPRPVAGRSPSYPTPPRHSLLSLAVSSASSDVVRLIVPYASISNAKDCWDLVDKLAADPKTASGDWESVRRALAQVEGFKAPVGYEKEDPPPHKWRAVKQVANEWTFHIPTARTPKPSAPKPTLDAPERTPLPPSTPLATPKAPATTAPAPAAAKPKFVKLKAVPVVVQVEIEPPRPQATFTFVKYADPYAPGRTFTAPTPAPAPQPKKTTLPPLAPKFTAPSPPTQPKPKESAPNRVPERLAQQPVRSTWTPTVPVHNAKDPRPPVPSPPAARFLFCYKCKTDRHAAEDCPSAPIHSTTKVAAPGAAHAPTQLPPPTIAAPSPIASLSDSSSTGKKSRSRKRGKPLAPPPVAAPLPPEIPPHQTQSQYHPTTSNSEGYIDHRSWKTGPLPPSPPSSTGPSSPEERATSMFEPQPPPGPPTPPVDVPPRALTPPPNPPPTTSSSEIFDYLSFCKIPGGPTEWTRLANLLEDEMFDSVEVLAMDYCDIAGLGKLGVKQGVAVRLKSRTGEWKAHCAARGIWQ